MLDPRPKYGALNLFHMKNITLKHDRAYFFDESQIALVRETLRGRQNITVLKQTIYTLACGLFLVKGHFLNHPINEQLTGLVESGLMDFWINNYQKNFPKEEESGDPQTLTLQHLYFGFVIWFATTIVAVGVFCMEIVMKRFEMRRIGTFLP